MGKVTKPPDDPGRQGEVDEGETAGVGKVRVKKAKREGRVARREVGETGGMVNTREASGEWENGNKNDGSYKCKWSL